MWEDYGCNHHDLIVLAIDGINENNSTVINADLCKEMQYPKVSGVEGGGGQVAQSYGITGYPSTRLIAPDKKIKSSSNHPDEQEIRSILTGGGIEEMDCNPTDIITEKQIFSNATDWGSIQRVTKQNIYLSILTEGNYSLTVFTADGRMVDAVFYSFFDSGVHTVTWNGKNLGSGVVIVTLSSGDYKITGKYVLQ